MKNTMQTLILTAISTLTIALTLALPNAARAEGSTRLSCEGKDFSLSFQQSPAGTLLLVNGRTVDAFGIASNWNENVRAEIALMGDAPTGRSISIRAALARSARNHSTYLGTARLNTEATELQRSIPVRCNWI